MALIICVAAFAAAFVCLFIVYHFIDGYISSSYENRASLVSKQTVEEIGRECFEFEAGSEDFDYAAGKQRLDAIRNMSAVNSIYLIKELGNKEVYVISSFDSYKNNYVPGSEVDKEIQNAALQALLGKYYFEKCTVSAEKGSSNLAYVYIAPVYNENMKIIGAVGIEFNVGDFIAVKDMAYKTVILAVCVLILILIIISLIVINSAIGRIVKDIFYTDNLTGLKNRSAYKKRIDKINSKIKTNIGDDPEIGIVVYNLNDLRIVNDTFGQLAGDEYIKNSAKTIAGCFDSLGATYRIGGDEFVTIVKNNSSDAVSEALAELELAQEMYNLDNNSSPFVMSISVGYDYFVLGTDFSLESVEKRADEKMYKAKKDKKRSLDRSPR